MKLKVRKIKQTGIDFKNFDGLNSSQLNKIKGGEIETPPEDLYKKQV